MIAAVIIVLAMPACAAQPSAFTPPRLVLPFEHYSLPNGLEVTLRADRRVPVAAVNIWYHVGPANEDTGSTGFAHLFEHMMLQGSGHAPGDYFQRLQAAGATAVNGNTDLDRTSYLEDVPSNQLELALWLESDRMGFLLDAVDQKTLSNQQAVVRNERRQNIENAPYGLAQEEVYRLLFPKGHPYHASVLGSHSDIQAANLADIRKFFKRFYVPNNASLSVVGDIDIASTKKLVRKYFGSIPKGKEVSPVKVEPQKLAGERRKTLTDSVELPRVYAAWHSPAAFKNGDAAATVTARLLGGGKASRLFENLVYRQQVAQSASARQRSLAHGSVFQVVSTARPGHSAAQVEKAIMAELERLGEDGPGRKELAATKTALVAVAIKSLEPFSGVADRLNAYNHFLGHPGYLNKDLRRYWEVTADDVKEFVRDTLLADEKVVLHVEPGKKKLGDEPATPAPNGGSPPTAGHHPAAAKSSMQKWRNEVPKAGPAATAPLPVADSFELKNGLKVFVSQSDSLPLVNARLVALQGTASDPPELPGLADFTAAMLNEGAGSRGAIDIADDLTALGSTLETGAGKETSWVKLEALRPQLRKSISIMADVALAPAFEPREIERLRNDRLAAVAQQRDQPMTAAFKVMWRELYGPGHPYAHGDLGTEESIRNTTRADLQSAYKRMFAPANSALIFAGNINRKEARKLATKIFGNWKAPGSRPPAPPEGNSGAQRVLIVDKPGAPQTAVVLAQTGPPRSHPDFGKLAVANRTLGGLFSSRLNVNLRETHGYTYSVASVVSQNRGPGPIYISTSVEAKVTAAAIKQALGEVSRLKRSGVTEDELKEAKDSILYSVADLFDTNASTASTIADLYAWGIPQDTFRTLPERLAAMSAADISSTASRHLRPDEMKIIAVGDRKQIESALRGLGLGEVGYRTTDGLAQ